jgi:hypothetical protein
MALDVVAKLPLPTMFAAVGAWPTSSAKAGAVPVTNANAAANAMAALGSRDAHRRGDCPLTGVVICDRTRTPSTQGRTA